MRSNISKLVFTGMMLILAGSETAFAKAYSPEALSGVVETARTLAAQGLHPVVMFDLDDTLTNTRERTLRILKDFAAQPQVQADFPEAAPRVAQLSVEAMRYLLADTLNQVGIADAEFVKQANDFWLAHFFTNEYCAADQPNPGAALYLHQLIRAGAKIVYLTGRDTPRMGEGTAANLKRNRFPMNSTNALLIMKPDPAMDDLKFKESQYAAVAALGDVIGVFENEPANINSMATAFPNAEAIFLDTIHSPKPDVPLERVEWVADFRH